MSVSIIIQQILLFTPLPIDLSKIINDYIAFCIYRLCGVNFKGTKETNSCTVLDVNHINTVPLWIPIKSTFIPRFGASAVMYRDRYIFLTGGYTTTHDEPLRSMERYDILSDNWINVEPMIQSRSLHCTVLLDDMIFVLGGVNQEAIGTVACEAYHPLKGIWKKITPMQTARANAAAVVINNMIYICIKFKVVIIN